MFTQGLTPVLHATAVLSKHSYLEHARTKCWPLHVIERGWWCYVYLGTDPLDAVPPLPVDEKGGGCYVCPGTDPLHAVPPTPCGGNGGGNAMFTPGLTPSG